MTSLFGTDGVRGIANRKLTPEIACALGRAGARILTGGNSGQVVVGRDTRISGPMLEGALAAGIASSGVDVLRVGVLSTPGVAFLTHHLGADGGVVISASHNPMEYNGIKFFDAQGYKLSDSMEQGIEREMRSSSRRRPVGSAIGKVEDLRQAREMYIDHARQTVAIDFTGLKVVLDCAHGASYRTAPLLLERMGVELAVINHQPDGININRGGGSTAPQRLQEEVVKRGADIGLAHDGDADRLIAVDEQGNLVDGDHILAICGLDLLARDRLPRRTMVATVYSNFGLKETFRRSGGNLVLTANGDRYVLAEMRDNGYILGGEKSGHIIFLEHTTTGDGMITALQLLAVIRRTGRRASQLAAQMIEYPQVLRNVDVKSKDDWEDNEQICRVIANAKQKLDGEGRIFVRASGTEPKIRILVEGKDENMIEQVAEEVATVVEDELN